jgi:predicted GNAT family acetyltransferase
MLIQHEEKENGKGSFFIMENDKRLAEMTYTMANKNLLIIDHTEVDEVLKGKNIGFQLVRQGVEFARENHLKIFPLCPFAKSVFDKKMDEFGDVLR